MDTSLKRKENPNSTASSAEPVREERFSKRPRKEISYASLLADDSEQEEFEMEEDEQLIERQQQALSNATTTAAEEKQQKNVPTVASIVRREKNLLSKFHKWTPSDDLLLKNAIERGLHPDQVAEQVKFSVRFSSKEIEDRWRALLYDRTVAEASAKAISILSQTNGKRVPWSEEEDKIILDELKKRGYISFQNMLDKHRDKFHPCRTIKSLEAHFYRMKRNGGFDGISHLHHAQAKLRSESIESLPEAEKEAINGGEGVAVGAKLTKAQEKRLAKQAATLEKEHAANPIKKSKKAASKKKTTSKKKKEETVPAADIVKQEPVEGQVSLSPQKPTAASSSAINEEEFHLATFEGHNCKLDVTKDRSVIGRKAAGQDVDIDVSLEGSAGKVSRKQAELILLPVRMTTTITAIHAADDSSAKGSTSHKKTGHIVAQFQLKNLGKRDIHVNNQLVKPNSDIVLTHNCLVKFPGDLKFNFSIDEMEVQRWIEYQESKHSNANVMPGKKTSKKKKAAQE